MYLIKFSVLLLFALFLDIRALNCRSDAGPKEEQLKTIYKNCLKKQDGNGSSNNRNYADDDWRESKGYNQRSQWDRDRSDRDDRMGNRDDKMNKNDRYGDSMGNRDDRIGGREDRMTGREDRMTGREDRMTGREDRIMGREDFSRVRDDMMGNRNNGFGRSDISGRDDFPHSEEFGSDMSYNFRSSTQPTRRFKREKRVGTNSGQRSQYNPNASSTQRPEYEDSYRNDRNSSQNSSKDHNKDNKACALHCFMENLEMTGDNGMPDKYLVTHVITKDVKNEDLKDFLQESIEECFQILDNENNEDKCDFSKNLLMCLSEKGRSNCDDWKDDMQF